MHKMIMSNKFPVFWKDVWFYIIGLSCEICQGWLIWGVEETLVAWCLTYKAVGMWMNNSKQ